MTIKYSLTCLILIRPPVLFFSKLAAVGVSLVLKHTVLKSGFIFRSRKHRPLKLRNCAVTEASAGRSLSLHNLPETKLTFGCLAD